MPLLDFRPFSRRISVASLLGAPVVVWIAGTKLTYYADAISRRIKLSKALRGVVLHYPNLLRTLERRDQTFMSIGRPSVGVSVADDTGVVGVQTLP